jgi:hypothetical protein
MERLFERLGYASQWLSDTLQERMSAAAESGEDLRGEAADLLDDAGDRLPDEVPPEMIRAAAGAAGAWVAARYLRRERIRWSRAVIAGVAGTLLYDLLERVDRRRSGAMPRDPQELRDLLTDEVRSTDWTEVGARYGAGVALAIFYAGYLHRRLPGPAPLRGAIFGALDAAALQWGGILPLLQHLHPDLELPAGIGALSGTGATDPLATARHVAFGTAVATVYGEG